MVIGLLKRGWRAKPGVTDELYLRMLDHAFFRAFEYRDINTISHEWGLTADSRLNNDEIETILAEAKAEFDAFESAVRNLEQISPQSKELVDVHATAVAYFRANLLHQDRFMMSIVEALRGQDRMANKYRKEAAGWQQSAGEVHHELRKEIAKMVNRRPDVFIEMKLSASVLEDLGLWR